MLKKLLGLLKYPSTQQGLVILMALVGALFNPEQASAIAGTGASLYGLLKVFTSDTDVK